jgi:hypothetical protein
LSAPTAEKLVSVPVAPDSAVAAAQSRDRRVPNFGERPLRHRVDSDRGTDTERGVRVGVRHGPSSEHTGMQLKTILNYVERHKSFVYRDERLVQDAKGQRTIEVRIEPRAIGRPICSGCQRSRPGYDRLPPRRFVFVPWGAIPVFFVYALRRVNCPDCGVTVEAVPWGDGKGTLTQSYRWFLVGGAQRLSWQETAEVFGTSWDNVFRAVKRAVLWGLVQREIKGLQALGVDEIQWRRGHQYLTLVDQIDQGIKRLLGVAQDRVAAGGTSRTRRAGRSSSRFSAAEVVPAEVHVQRPVAALPERVAGAGTEGRPGAGPVPRQAKFNKAPR